MSLLIVRITLFADSETFWRVIKDSNPHRLITDGDGFQVRLSPWTLPPKIVEGRVGFEPTDRFQSPDFKSGAIDLSTTYPFDL